MVQTRRGSSCNSVAAQSGLFMENSNCDRKLRRRSENLHSMNDDTVKTTRTSKRQRISDGAAKETDNQLKYEMETDDLFDNNNKITEVKGTTQVEMQVNKEEAKSTSSEDSSEDDNSDITDFERRIQENVKSRLKMMESLNILEAKKDLLNIVSPQPSPKPKPPKILKTSPEVRRKSNRLQKKDAPDNSGVDYFVIKYETKNKDEMSVAYKPKPDPGPAELENYYKLTNKEDCDKFKSELKLIKTSTKNKYWNKSFESVTKTLKSLKLADDDVVKVIPSRTYSIQFHPTTDSTVLFVGGKLGELGILNMDSTCDEKDHYFNIHKYPINCMALDKWNHNTIYTSSYDSSFRKVDLTTSIVKELYEYTVVRGEHRISWFSQYAANKFLLACSQGNVVNFDDRSKYKSRKLKVDADDYSVKIVVSHPVNNNYFITGVSSGKVSLWDLRNYKSCCPISSIQHGRTISSLDFSPVTGNTILSTCAGNYIGVINCDLNNLTFDKHISHNTNTGRWLTTFRSRFFPNREDLFIVGSLDSPRNLYCCNVDGTVVHTLQGKAHSTVTSIAAVHPHKKIIAGANSSGRVYIYR